MEEQKRRGRRSNQQKEEVIDVKVENTGSLGVINNYAGQFISIDLSKRTFFGVGRNDNGSPKIWLSEENWCDQIQPGLTDEEVMIVANSLRSGEIVLGKRWLPVLEKDKAVMSRYVALLGTNRRISEDFKATIRHLVNHKSEGNYTALEILRAMIKQEESLSARKEFINFLEDCCAMYKGPDMLVKDFPNDPNNFRVVIDPTSKKVTHIIKKDGSYEEMTNTKGRIAADEVDLTPERESAIRNALD